jgi:predicted O-linked N-acetylglucosamine transferase (SPINDLY family)
MTAALNRAERRKAEKLAKRSAAAPGQAPVQMSLMAALTEAARRHQSGDFKTAESLYEAVLRSAPDNLDALQLLGVLRFQTDRHEQGLALLEQAHAKAPDNVEVLANFGAVLIQLEDYGKAEPLLRRALELAPKHLEVRLNLVRLLAKSGRAASAATVCREAAAQNLDTMRFHKLLGEVLLKERDYTRSAEAFTAALAEAPDDIEIMNDLAICCRELGDMAAAEKWYREALKRAPDRTEISYNLGAFLLGLGRVDDAREHLDRVLADKPDHWMTLAMLSLNLVKMGNEREAIATLHRVTDAHPDDPNVWNDIGALFMELGIFDEAAKKFARACELNPDLIESRTNLGNAFLRQGLGIDAIREYEAAIKMRPMHLEAHVALCRALKDVFRFDEANVYAHGTLMLPNYGPKYFSNPLQIFRATCDYEGLAELGDIWKILDTVQPVDVTTALLQLLVYAEDDETVHRLAGHARRWTEIVEAQAAAAPLPPRPAAAPKQKLRIGLLSSDLRRHAVSRFVLPLVEKYDREKFEIFCYSPNRVDDDHIQQRFRSLADKFAYVVNATDRETALTIARDDVDILFELNGFTHGTRLAATAWRPAPVQIAWLGYPFTTTMTAMDYVLVDEYLKPVGDGGLVEKPLVMPGSWVCFGEGVNFEPVPILPEAPLERNGIVTFGTLNNTYKFTPKVFALWAEVMKAVPNSRFLVVRPECGSMLTCRNIAKRFEEQGISTDRLYFVNNRGKGLSHLAYYNDIDVSLDTFPVTGGTTTTEAAWMGVPTVSLVGHAIHQRVSYAILKHCGLDECCAETPEEFVAKAATLCDPAKLRELRREMRTRLQNSTLARPDLFVENFQATMEELARRHGLR